MSYDQFIQSDFLNLWTIGSGVREALLTPQIWNDNIAFLESCIEAEHNADGSHKAITLFNEDNVAAGIASDYSGRMYFYDSENNQITLTELATAGNGSITITAGDVMDIVASNIVGDGIDVDYDSGTSTLTLTASASGGAVIGGGTSGHLAYWTSDTTLGAVDLVTTSDGRLLVDENGDYLVVVL